MTVPKSLMAYVDSKKVNYSHILHPAAYTAEDVAHSIHCPKHQLAKVIAIHADDRDLLAILPACDKLDMKSLKRELGSREVTLFSETELKTAFNDCEIGTTPVFGHLYGMDVIASTNLLEDAEIYFNAGTHTDAMKCTLEEFINIEHPVFAQISTLHKDNFVCRDLDY
ncbi:hypothetical protein BIY24_10875 [Halobacteriovorax marinus]|nr:YbaK/EbsC family protein [Halobacteriovorax marinus]ATH08433.1 hypothetical protein BIY24_10875 [Halobacteriovorax marinus]